LSRRAAFAAAVLLACSASPAPANDSVAEVTAGGLELRETSAVSMLAEDLFVSAEQVRVQYRFRNDRSRAGVVEAIVAFPMPDRDLSLEREGDVAFPSDFRTLVDGKPVATRTELKAMLDGADMSAILTAMKLSIAGSPEAIDAALEALSPVQRDELLRLRLAEVEEYGAGAGALRLVPLWTIRETHYWPQAFRADRETRIEHSYRPGTGMSVGTALVDRAFRRSAEGRRMIADYCIDAAFLAGLDRLARRAGGDYPLLGEQRFGYILTTGGNWAQPIGDFRMVIDKGAAENLVSFCASGVRKISPTQFQVSHKNWRPDRDLKVLVIFPHRPTD
jgi:hypothetical protein